MPENKNRSTPRSLLVAMGLTAGLIVAPQAFAADKMGYVQNTSGEVWTTAGGCLRSTVDVIQGMEACGDGKKEEVAAAPKVEKKAAPAAIPAATPNAINCDAVAYFDFDRSALKAEMKAMLDELASKVNASPAPEKVMVVGHTDSVGSEAYNVALSNRRAKSVASYLTEKGLDVTSVSGEGESSPVASNASNEGRAKNRRSEITCH